MLTLNATRYALLSSSSFVVFTFTFCLFENRNPQIALQELTLEGIIDWKNASAVSHVRILHC
jgi:hypothetical protein